MGRGLGAGEGIGFALIRALTPGDRVESPLCFYPGVGSKCPRLSRCVGGCTNTAPQGWDLDTHHGCPHWCVPCSPHAGAEQGSCRVLGRGVWVALCSEPGHLVLRRDQ